MDFEWDPEGKIIVLIHPVRASSRHLPGAIQYMYNASEYLSLEVYYATTRYNIPNIPNRNTL